MDLSVARSSGVLPLSSVTSGQEWVRDFIMDNDSHNHIPNSSSTVTIRDFIIDNVSYDHTPHGSTVTTLSA